MPTSWDHSLPLTQASSTPAPYTTVNPHLHPDEAWSWDAEDGGYLHHQELVSALALVWASWPARTQIRAIALWGGWGQKHLSLVPLYLSFLTSTIAFQIPASRVAGDPSTGEVERGRQPEGPQSSP